MQLCRAGLFEPRVLKLWLAVPASTTIGIPAPIIMDTMMASIMIGMETMTTGSRIDHAGRQMRGAIADLRSRSATEHHEKAGFVPERGLFQRTILPDRYDLRILHIGQFNWRQIDHNQCTMRFNDYRSERITL
jgi:hypothetical protein